MSDKCVISSVLSHCSKNWSAGPVLKLCYSSVSMQTSVMAWLQLSLNVGPMFQLSYSSVLFGKQRKIHPQGMRAGRPKRSWEEWRGEAWGSILAPLFSFFLLPLSLPYVNWVSHEGCLFHLRFSLWCLDLSLFSFHGLFSSLSFSLTFPNYLTFPPQKLGGIILWEYGHPGLSGYCFLLS